MRERQQADRQTGRQVVVMMVGADKEGENAGRTKERRQISSYRQAGRPITGMKR